MRSLLWILVVILSVAAVNVQAQLFYPAKGNVHSAYAAQLWYTGYWKHVRPRNLLGNGAPCGGPKR